jgi:hypothetical protein
MTVHENAPIPGEESEVHQDEEAEERFDDESLAREPSSHAVDGDPDDSLQYPNDQA